MVNCVEPKHCHVALLMGGTSGEREVSLASGEGAHKALLEAGYQVTVLDPAESNDLKALIDGNFDVAFICLHGKHGEDGTLQGFLEMIELPYIGSGVWSSSLAMDKVKSKVFYKLANIPTPPSLTLEKNEVFNVHDIVEELGSHCVVKPSSEGSALGVFIVEGGDAIKEAVEKVKELDGGVLIEQYIKGKELTVAVIGTSDPYALPIIEIIPINDFYDYESKYAPGASKHVCPAPLPYDVTQTIQTLAVKAHQVLGCSGVSRSDFILDNEGSCWLLETNTIPGMTGTSLLPDAARAAGISFSELCNKLIGYALEK